MTTFFYALDAFQIDDSLHHLQPHCATTLAQSLDHLLSTIEEHPLPHLGRAWQFWFAFEAIADLVSNAVHILSHDDPLTFTQLQDIPSRHDIIGNLVVNAPKISELPAYVDNLLTNLPTNERTCSICTTTWSTPAKPDDSEEQTGPWLRWLNEGSSLLVKSGLEDVPLKMDCSHVFCAGCIKQWLDSPRRVQCPYRDEDYGIHRSGTSVRIFRLGVSFGLKMSMVKFLFRGNANNE